jgi:transketolase
MRLLRGQVPRVLDPDGYRFAIGKAAPLRHGSDVGIVSTGLMTERALDAARLLDARGVAAGVLHVPTLKPFDTEAVAAFCGAARAVVTAENHVTRGGLGSQVAEALLDAGLSRPLGRVGIGDGFVELGAVPTLFERAGMTAGGIVAAAMDALARAP